MANADIQTYVQSSAFQAVYTELQTLQAGATGQMAQTLSSVLICLDALNLMSPLPTTMTPPPTTVTATGTVVAGATVTGAS